MFKTFKPKTESLGAYLLRMCPCCDYEGNEDEASDVTFSDFDYEDTGCRWYVTCDSCGTRSDVRLYSDRRHARVGDILVDSEQTGELVVDHLRKLGVRCGLRTTLWNTYVEPAE